MKQLMRNVNAHFFSCCLQYVLQSEEILQEMNLCTHKKPPKNRSLVTSWFLSRRLSFFLNRHSPAILLFVWNVVAFTYFKIFAAQYLARPNICNYGNNKLLYKICVSL